MILQSHLIDREGAFPMVEWDEGTVDGDMKVEVKAIIIILPKTSPLT